MVLMKVIIAICINDSKQKMFHQSLRDEEHPNPGPAVISQHSPMDQLAALPYTDIDGCLCRETPEELTECYSETCKKFPASLKIQTPVFKIVQSSIEEIGRDDLMLFTNLTTLEIEYNLKLTKLQSGCFRNLSKLSSLSIFCNFDLSYLDENVFEGLVSLNLLDLRKNGFIRITDITRAVQAVYLPQLKILEMHENKFEVIDKYDFYTMNNTIIEQLNLIGCSINYIHPECLLPLRYLNMIRLGRNFLDISTIGTLMNTSVDLGIKFLGMNLYDAGLRGQLPYNFLIAVGRTNMSYLYMAENNFESVEDDSLPEMPNLLGIDLRFNLLTRISRHAFRKLPRLETLLLSGNKFTTIPEGTLIPNLWELEIAVNSADEENSFFFIPDYIFENMTRLSILTLSGNNIAFLPSNSFIGLKNLTVLKLQSCFLERIELNTFGPLINLNYLNLKNNPLLGRSLTFNVFKGLRNLKRLELSGCALQNLTSNPNLFAFMPNLTYLGLSWNGIKVVAPEQFLTLRYIKELHLYGNELLPWTEQMVLPSGLSVLDVGKNKLTYITIEMLEDWSKVDRLFLDDNPLTCDCSLYTMHLWVTLNNLTAKYMHKRNLSGFCIQPPILLSEYLLNEANFGTLCKLWYKGELPTVCVTLLLSLMFFIVLCYMCRWYIGYWRFLLRVKCQWRERRLLKDYSACRYDAFVSYCSTDRNFVLRLVSMLENYEPYLKLCFYERDFQVGNNISEEIFRHVLVSRRTLLIVSEAFATSHWCRWETQLAEYHDIFFYNERANHVDDSLVMVKLGPMSKSSMTPTLKYLMESRIYLEWDSDPMKERLFWMKLRSTLAAKKEHFSDVSL